MSDNNKFTPPVMQAKSTHVFNPFAPSAPPQEALPNGPIKAWSPSTLILFETCNYALFLKAVRKLAQEQSTAGDRGTKLHELAEQYVRGDTDVIGKDLVKITGALNHCRAAYAEGKVQVEEEWGFTKLWEPCDWHDKNVWGRVKLDIFLLECPTSAEIIDWKSGKKFGNETKHNLQGMIYAIAAFTRYPMLEFVKTTFEYIGTGDSMKNTYTRDIVMNVLKPRITNRALLITSTTDFLPRPSQKNCKYCFKECEYRAD